MIKLPAGAAEAFNQWMQNCIDHPERFRKEWQSVHEFMETPEGEEPDYGQSCVAYLERLLEAQEVSSLGQAEAPATASSS